MKIKCQFCDAMINDTLDKCPNCGAPNENVTRITADQPKTIEELQKWYTSHGLPPFNVTRFFIGENYLQPRAFGIYKENDGNFVVYKNKDSGGRVIRYRGTDEAYAVNELYMRLKQEIIEQKSRNISKAQNTNNSSNPSDEGLGKSLLKGVKSFFIFIGVIIACFIAFCFAVSIIDDSPSKGYYLYNDKPYYYYSYDEVWFELDSKTGDWKDSPLNEGSVPEELKTDKTSDDYYLSYDWDEKYKLPDFEKSNYFLDRQNHAKQGYYKYDDINYYNLTGDYDSGWYSYDDYYDWVSVDESDVPSPLKHYQTSQDFYFTPTWDASTQFTDFEDSAIYREYEEEQSSKSDESSSDDDYTWDSSDSWDSDGTDWDSDW